MPKEWTEPDVGGGLTLTRAAKLRRDLQNSDERSTENDLDPHDPHYLMQHRRSVPAAMLAKLKDDKLKDAGGIVSNFHVTAGAKKRMTRIPTLRHAPWEDGMPPLDDEAGA